MPLFSSLCRMLRNNRISCIHNDSFTGLRNVRLLSLYDNQITTIAPGAFDTLQSLSTLYVLGPGECPSLSVSHPRAAGPLAWWLFRCCPCARSPVQEPARQPLQLQLPAGLAGGLAAQEEDRDREPSVPKP